MCHTGRARACASMGTMRAALALMCVALACAVGACVREGAPPIAPVEVSVGDVDAGVAQIPIAPIPRVGRCVARLSPSPIQTATGCTLDERISTESGVLTYPCSGTGPAEAVFGEHRFEGSMKSGTLALDLTTEIDWEDKCHWETKQHINGALQGRGSTKPLAWTYSEAPVTGENCYGSCKATADITVEEPANGR